MSSFEFDILPKRKAFVRLLGDIHESLYRMVEDSGLSRSEISDRVECHRSSITRRLNGTANLTLESMSDIIWACDSYGEFKITPIAKVNANWHDTPDTHGSTAMSRIRIVVDPDYPTRTTG